MEEQRSPGEPAQQRRPRLALESHEEHLTQVTNFANKQAARQATLAGKIQVVAGEGLKMTSEARRLLEKNEKLRDNLESAQSTIFSLQPYLKETYPPRDLKAQGSDDMLTSIEHWVQKSLQYWLENPETALESLKYKAQQRPEQLEAFRAAIYEHVDLVHASYEADVDEDVIASLIARFLKVRVLESTFLGCEESTTTAIEEVHQLLRDSSNPPRDPVFVRGWRAEAYNALLTHPSYTEARETQIHQLTAELAEILWILCPNHHQEDFLLGLKDDYIRPAASLQNKLCVSIQEFLFEIEGYIADENNNLVAKSNFWDNFESLDCINILRNTRKLKLSHLGDGISRELFQDRLLPIGAVSPALILKRPEETGDHALVTIRRQSMLIAWDCGSDVVYPEGDQLINGVLFELK